MIKDVYLEPVYVDTIPEILEEKKLYISKQYHTAIHLCACGCKNQTVTRFAKDGDKPNNYIWDLLESEGKITLMGSIGNFNFPCKSHYIIINNIANDC